MQKLLVGTRNDSKMAELKDLLRELPFELVFLDQVGITQEVEETEDTFEGNAVLKAECYGRIANMITVADDSGIEVDALNGEPGVLSARYGGEGLNDKDRNDLLLENLSEFEGTGLSARFKCVVAVYNPEDGTEVFEGKIEGIITHEPRGENGFGYDPLFFYPQKRKTLAEISAKEKHVISHRGKAVRKAAKYLYSVSVRTRG